MMAAKNDPLTSDLSQPTAKLTVEYRSQ